MGIASLGLTVASVGLTIFYTICIGTLLIRLYERVPSCGLSEYYLYFICYSTLLVLQHERALLVQPHGDFRTSVHQYIPTGITYLLWWPSCGPSYLSLATSSTFQLWERCTFTIAKGLRQVIKLTAYVP